MNSATPAARTPSRRRDANANRARLLEATREVFGTLGPDSPLEEIARVAGVSRTTLYRNFATREELAAAVYESNVLRHEEDARSLAGQPRAIVLYFDSIMLSLSRHLGITRVMLGSGVEWYEDLSARMKATFEPLLTAGIRDGVVRPGVGVAEIMLAFHLAECALADDLQRGVTGNYDAVHHLLRTALFDLPD